MSRNLLGILAIGMLIGGIVMIAASEGGSMAMNYAGVFIRVGLILAALWLALPQITSFFKNTPRWLMIAAAIGVALAAINWQLLLLLIPVAGALWLFGPRLLSKAKGLPTNILSSKIAKMLPTSPPPGRRARRKRGTE